MRILAYKTQPSNGKVLLRESTGQRVRSNGLDALLSFLLEPQGNSWWKPPADDCLRVFWDLDEGVSLLLKLLGDRQCRRLYETHKCHYPPFEIFYIPSKVLSLKYIPSRAKANFYDLKQFFPELDEPEDLVEVQMLGEKLIYELGKMGLGPPRLTKLTSPVAIWDECVLAYLDLPVLVDIPKEAAIYASMCTSRTWIEAMVLGCWDKSFSYDLASAYAMVAKDLVDFRYCRWVKSKEYQPDALYGYLKSRTRIHDGVRVSPILMEQEDGSLESRTGVCERITQKQELDFIYRWGIGEVEILDGWWCIPPRHKGDMPKPLKGSTERLLAYKQQTGLQAALAKRMSMFSGKFGEERKEGFGPYYNPVWKSEINTTATMQVAEWLYSHGIGPGDNEGFRHLIAITVDGALLDTEVEARGQWRLSYTGPALVASSGLVYMGEKHPKGLLLDDILAMIKEHPGVSYYEKRIIRRVTLGDALSSGKFEELGTEKPMVTTIDLYRQEHDRAFPRLPKTGRQLLNNKYPSELLKVEEG